MEDDKKYSWDIIKNALFAITNQETREVQYSKERLKTREQKSGDKVLRKISNLIYLTVVNKNHNELKKKKEPLLIFFARQASGNRFFQILFIWECHHFTFNLKDNIGFKILSWCFLHFNTLIFLVHSLLIAQFPIRVSL